MVFQITALYALPLAILGLVLWFRVTIMRSNLNVSIGEKGDLNLLQKIRQHGNFIEWVPMILILMVIAEGNGAGVWLHISGSLILIGRLVHPFGLKIDNASHPLRYVGNIASLLALLNVLICIVVTSAGL
ncbi:MAG: MAPEG family protein [Leptospira sp.]|nr:MAPEG family protein [Leptospira sp.]